MQKLGMSTLCPNYINTYWSSEHGSIVLGHAFGDADHAVTGNARMFAMPWVDAEVWVPTSDANEDGRMRYCQMVPEAQGSDKGRLVIRTPWPSMARTMWGDAEAVGAPSWVGNLEGFRERYWSSFCLDGGSSVMALDLADIAQTFRCGGTEAFSILGHSRDELRLGSVKMTCAELEATLFSTSPLIIDCVVVALPEQQVTRHVASTPGTPSSIPIACLVLPDGVEVDEELDAQLKQSVHEEFGERFVPVDFVSIPAIPRTHNSKPMRNVVKQLFLGRAKGVSDMSEIANPQCLLELKAVIDQWRYDQALPMLDERC
jgi:acrylyl-CoA reductase (NADPH)/3-hydroxypropionyl-CoA dehydratase/3-hydroxypropionyl-CoA synthetase